MRLQHLEQTAAALSTDTPARQEAKAVIVVEADRLRWRLWNGKAKDAQASIERIRAVMHHFRGEPGSRRSIAPSRKLWTALLALDGYLVGQADLRWPPSVGQFDGLDKLGPGFVRPPTSLPRSPRRPRRGSVRPAHYAGVRHCNSRSTSKARPATPSRSRRHAGKCTRISGCARAAR
jgi:hypothetical protein